MPRRMTIAPHLSTEELQARFCHAKTPTVAHHYQIMWLLACGKTTAEVMAVTAYSRGWIYEASLGIQPFRISIFRRSLCAKIEIVTLSMMSNKRYCGKFESSLLLMAGSGMAVHLPIG
jgi:hypothetical protein